jgi:hypothetical protein
MIFGQSTILHLRQGPDRLFRTVDALEVTEPDSVQTTRIFERLSLSAPSRTCPN